MTGQAGISGEGITGSEWRWTLAAGLVSLVLALVAALLPVIEWAPTGGLVGWLLLLAGASEAGFGFGRGADLIGRTAIVAGLITMLSGLVFVARPFADLFPVGNVVMVWLLARGAFLVARSGRIQPSRAKVAIAAAGIADLALGFALVIKMPVAAFVVSLFGTTPEIVASFGLVLAASFLVTGLSQVAIAWTTRES